MRRLKNIWLVPGLLLVAFVALAAWDVPPAPCGVVIGSGGGSEEPAAATCADGCTATADADVFCEDAEGSGALCSGWATTTTGGTISFDSTVNQNLFTHGGKGDQNIDIHTTSANDVYAKIELPTASTEFYMSAWIIFDDIGLGEDEWAPFLTFRILGSGTDAVAIMYLGNHGDGNVIGVDDLETDDYYEGTSYLVEDTPYKIEFTYNSSNGAGSDIMKLVVNGTTMFNETGLTLSRQIQGLYIGDLGGYTDDPNFRFQINSIKIDNDAMPANN